MHPCMHVERNLNVIGRENFLVYKFRGFGGFLQNRIYLHVEFHPRTITPTIIVWSGTVLSDTKDFLISPHGRKYCKLITTIGHIGRARSCAICDATPNCLYFGSAKINISEFYLARPDFAFREKLKPSNVSRPRRPMHVFFSRSISKPKITGTVTVEGLMFLMENFCTVWLLELIWPSFAKQVYILTKMLHNANYVYTQQIIDLLRQRVTTVLQL